MNGVRKVRGRAATSALALAAVLIAGLAMAPPPGMAADQATFDPTEPVSTPVERRADCQTASRPFRPARVVIPGVVGSTRVLARGRDRNGAPLPPPLTDRGRWQLAWDRQSRIRAGSDRGVVRMLAHTYPRSGIYGTALGNRLLARLHVEDRIEVAGPEGQKQCYRVSRRVRVRAGASLPSFYTSGGPPKLAILVCSGVRRGPGDWSHRTIWFARPLR